MTRVIDLLYDRINFIFSINSLPIDILLCRCYMDTIINIMLIFFLGAIHAISSATSSQSIPRNRNS